jgi:DNA polymerase-1
LEADVLLRIVIDIEANGLENPTEIWVIVCKDIDTGEYHIFRNVTSDDTAKSLFQEFSKGVDYWVGHNIIEFDLQVLRRLIAFELQGFPGSVIDTLIVSRLMDFSRVGGHSIKAYGETFGLPKGEWVDWHKYSLEMEEYCVRDVDVCHKIYLSYLDNITDPSWASAINLENEFQLICNNLHDHGFAFNSGGARSLLSSVKEELDVLDKEIAKVFPLKTRKIREISPRVTSFGTLHKGDFRWVKGGDLSEYNGGPFTRIGYEPFNPSSHKQVIEVLHAAGWAPTDKTTTHIEVAREVNRLKYLNKDRRALDISNSYDILLDKLEKFQKTGWKINEINLNTLPDTAPASARSLARRILLESRRRTLVEWLGLVHPDTGRIHGSFSGIGAWTHRMSHQKPNTANIPNEIKGNGHPCYLGKELRSLWQSPPNRLLVGVDAEGIQLRIFAHYIDDPEFTQSLVKGRKDDKTDPHSLNQRILGDVCNSRQAAKRFIYALLLGAGGDKLREILGCTREEADQALSRLLERYGGFAYLKRSQIPRDARRGSFIGLDGRRVRIPGTTDGERKHLCMSGYLQNGEAIIIKKAAIIAAPQLIKLDSFFVDIVHDEYQTETPEKMQIALEVAKIQASAIEEAGDIYNLKCPMSGSFYNDDHKSYTIGKNWSITH